MFRAGCVSSPKKPETVLPLGGTLQNLLGDGSSVGELSLLGDASTGTWEHWNSNQHRDGRECSVRELTGAEAHAEGVLHGERGGDVRGGDTEEETRSHVGEAQEQETVAEQEVTGDPTMEMSALEKHLSCGRSHTWTQRTGVRAWPSWRWRGTEWLRQPFRA